MNKSFGNDDPALERVMRNIYDAEDDVLREIRQRSAAAGLPDIQVAALDARHLEVLTRLASARRAVEIGTLGGYSGVAIARSLAAGGVLHTFEYEPLHARIAEESFRRAGVADRVRIHVGPAIERLRGVESEAPFDLVFIDADKESYDQYLEWAAAHLRPGGVVIGDNAFLFGEMTKVDQPSPSPALRAMTAFHQRLAHSGEFHATILPTGEGLAVAVRL